MDSTGQEYVTLFLGFEDLEERFQEVFQRFETLEKDDLSCPVTSETSCEEDDSFKCTEKEDNVEYI